MNKNQLAILSDISLSNQGYVAKMNTVFAVYKATGAKVEEVSKDFDELVAWGHLRLLGKNSKGASFYCFPKNYEAVLADLREITGG